MNTIDPYQHRWICLVHVKPSILKEYESPGSVGAFVRVVADAESEDKFIEKVRDTLENKMLFPIIEIEDIETLSVSHNLCQELQDSIENILPHFPIAFSPFYFYKNINDDDDITKR
jgi:hypothetical protein